jgi:hypothetical protein
MSDVKLHRTSVIKRGTSERIFLAFAGRRHHSSDSEQLTPKSYPTQELFGMLLLLGAAILIGVAIWHSFSRMY